MVKTFQARSWTQLWQLAHDDGTRAVTAVPCDEGGFILTPGASSSRCRTFKMA